MKNRHCTRNESFARSFTPHDPSGQPKLPRPHTITPGRRGLLSDSAQDLNACSSARPPHRVNYRSDIIDGGQSMGLRKPKSIKHNGKSLTDILEAHELFFSGKDGGVRADFTEAQASGVEFFRCDLSNVNFQRAQLRNVNLRLANVNGARFSGADMGVAILRETDLTGADLSGVDLSTALLPRGFTLLQAAKKSA